MLDLIIKNAKTVDELNHFQTKINRDEIDYFSELLQPVEVIISFLKKNIDFIVNDDDEYNYQNISFLITELQKAYSRWGSILIPIIDSNNIPIVPSDSTFLPETKYRLLNAITKSQRK